jgi:hypothetical protein
MIDGNPWGNIKINPTNEGEGRDWRFPYCSQYAISPPPKSQIPPFILS